MNSEDRIKLAVLMDIPECRHYGNFHVHMNEHFSPETNANDDYAVLEWFRSHYTGRKYEEVFGDELALSEWGIPAYKIGDYARAALKVINV